MLNSYAILLSRSSSCSPKQTQLATLAAEQERMRKQRQATLKGIRIAKDLIGDKMRGVREGSGGTGEIQKLFAEIEEVSVAKTSSSARSARSTPTSSRRKSKKRTGKEKKTGQQSWEEAAASVGEEATRPVAAAAAALDIELQEERREKSSSFGLPPHLTDIANEGYSLGTSASLPMF